MKYRLGDICEIVTGSTPKTGVPEYWDGELKWITPAELNDDSYVVNDTSRKLTLLGVQKTGLTSFPAGTVILSSRAPIGKVAIAGCEMYCNQGFKNLICSDKINEFYLFWFLKSKTEYLNSLGRGATFKEISKAILSSVEIELPPIETQNKVVLQLETIWRILNERKEELRQLDELVKARFVEMFGELFCSDAKHYTIPEIAFVYIGLVTTMTKHYVDEGTPLIFNSTVRDNFFEFKERVYLDEEFANANAHRKHKLNDVVTVHTGDVGTSAIIGPELDGSLGFATIVSRINDMEFVRPSYLCDFLNSVLCKYQLKNLIRGDRNNLNLKEFNQILLTVPPIEKQLEWEKFRKQVDKSKFVS